MLRRPPRSTRTDTLFPYTTLFRSAGNTNDSSSKVDAGGADAYFDNAANNGEQIPGCHRSESDAVHLGGAVRSLNLACPGARTSTHGGGDADFMSGIAFYDGPYGQGQRSEQRRVGHWCVTTWRSRWSPEHQKQNNHNQLT